MYIDMYIYALLYTEHSIRTRIEYRDRQSSLDTYKMYLVKY